MFKQKPKALIYLTRSGLYLYSKGVSKPVIFTFETDTVENLEVKNEDSLKEQIKSFLNKNKIKPTSAVILLSEELLFYKVFSSHNDYEKNHQQFLDEVPFDSQKITETTYDIDNKFITVVTNFEYYTVVGSALESIGWKIVHVIPEILFDKKNLTDLRAMEILGDTRNISLDTHFLKPYNKKRSKQKEQVRTLVSKKKLFIGVLILSLSIAAVVLVMLLDLGIKRDYDPVQEENSPLPSEIVEEATSSEEIILPVYDASEDEIDKQNLKIQVLNGTGVAGIASTFKEVLLGNGFENIDVGNADVQSYTITLITYLDSVNDNLVNEINDLLEEEFLEISFNKVSSGEINDDYDIIITTGKPIDF